MSAAPATSAMRMPSPVALSALRRTSTGRRDHADHLLVSLEAAIGDQYAGCVDSRLVAPVETYAETGAFPVFHAKRRNFRIPTERTTRRNKPSAQSFDHFVRTMIRPVEAGQHGAVGRHHELVHRGGARREVYAMIAQPIDSAAGIFSHHSSESRVGFVLGHAVDCGQQVVRLRRRVGISDMKGATGKSGVAGDTAHRRRARRWQRGGRVPTRLNQPSVPLARRR